MLFVLLTITVCLQPTFAADENNDTLMPKGIWKDPTTGLIWSRCSVGQGMGWNNLYRRSKEI
jgi:hypothetical protein